METEQQFLARCRLKPELLKIRRRREYSPDMGITEAEFNALKETLPFRVPTIAERMKQAVQAEHAKDGRKDTLPIEAFDPVFKGMVASGIPFELQETYSTKRLVQQPETVDGKPVSYFFSPAELSMRCLGLMVALRKHVERLAQPHVNEDSITYRSLASYRDAKYEQLHAVDISSAYANALLIAGFITPELFGRVQALPKRERQVCIGCLATSKSVQRFEPPLRIPGRKYDKACKPVPTPQPPALYSRPFFFAAAKAVENAMRELRRELGSDYVGFYTDCIYFQSDASVDIVRERLAEMGYQSKHEVIFDVRLKADSGEYTMSFVTQGDYTSQSGGKPTRKVQRYRPE